MSTQRSTPFIHRFERMFELTEADREHLHNMAQPSVEVPARRKLIEAGRRHERAFILKAGWMIEFKLLRDGRRQILNFRLPGEVAGIDSLAYAIAPHATATLTECTVTPLTRDDFREVHRRFPKLAAGLFLMTLREEAILHQWEISLGRRSAYQRTAYLIAELHYRAHLRGLTEGNSFPFPATQQDMADSLGLTPPYVNRILRRMREENLVRMEDRHLELLEPSELARKAGFDPGYLETSEQCGGLDH